MTFWCAQERARRDGGRLVLRSEDLDDDRCRARFREAIAEDLRWFGLRWDEGPDIGGAFGLYVQSGRREIYLAVWKRLRDAALIYPCTCSRRDVLQSASAPHHENEEPVYPGTCRSESGTISGLDSPAGHNWRFHVPDGEALLFVDQRLGTQHAIAGVDFGDFHRLEKRRRAGLSTGGGCR